VEARVREVAQQVGLFLLVSLMLFAVYNDLSRWIQG
jgi:membrane-associated protease RseP (regulator of RpoE activity)